MQNLTKNFLESLRSECRNVFQLCAKINAYPIFHDAVNDWMGVYRGSVGYQAEHIFLYDLLKIFKEVVTLKHSTKESSTPAQFVVLSAYELLNRNDLIVQYDIQKINELVHQRKFSQNITLIKEVTFFPEVESQKEKLVLPSVLNHMNNDIFADYVQCLEQLSLLMVKTGEKITDKEESFLKANSERIRDTVQLFSNSQSKEVEKDDTLEKVMEELNELVGLDDIKTRVQDLINFLKVKKLRQESGLRTTTNSLHAVFTGPPGTGKTTVARLLGRIFKHLGYLEKGQMIETDRSGMVAGYVGQTAIKSDEIIKKALDGVLFIDEAYSLNPEGINDFGGEAIEILLKRMEDNRKRLVVIVAGYPDEMNSFIQSNPGLQSRFNRYFHFDHYSPEAMMAIFKINAAQADFELTKDAEEKLSEIFDRLYEKRHRSFGNARVVRNLFERITEIQANRVAKQSDINHELLVKITEKDIPEILKTVDDLIMIEED
ncbi:MAG: AAA family ATPase [Marinoscillum sp.]